MKVKFSDVVRRANTKEDRFNTDKEFYVGGEHMITGEYLITRRGTIAGSNIGPMFYFGFKKGQVLLASRSPDLKKAGMVTFDGICSEKTFVIETKDESVLLQDFLPAIVRSEKFWKYANDNQSGSVNHFINWTTFANYEFDLPDIETQRKLSTLLWAMERTKTAYKNLIAKTDELVKSQFVEMITNSSEKNVLGDYIARRTPQRCGGRELPLLSVTKEKAVVFQSERFSAGIASVDKSNYIIAPRGFIIQGIHIDEGNFGLQNLVDEGIVSPAYKLWEVTNKNIIPELLEYYLRSDLAIDYFRRNFQGTTVARRQTILPKDFLAMPLNIPEMEEQKKYWDFKCQADKSKFAAQQALADLTAAQKALMWQYLG